MSESAVFFLLANFMTCKSSIDQLEEEPFCGAIQSYCEKLNAHYSERLESVYLFGSVHRDEADPVASDIDVIVVTTDGFSDEDSAWELRRWQDQEAFCDNPDVNLIKIGLTRASSTSEIQFALYPETLDLLQQDMAVRKVLNGTVVDAQEQRGLKAALSARTLLYDSTLVYGKNQTENAPLPVMNSLWAKFYLAAPYHLVQNTLYPQQETPMNWPFPLQPLHPNESRCLRKLARMGVLTCACLLMREGMFKSWEGDEVIPVVEERYPEWKAFLGKTVQYYIKTVQNIDKKSVLAYLKELFWFMEWVKSSSDGFDL